MAVGEVLPPPNTFKQDTLFDLPEVRLDGSENLDQNGKKKRKRGPPGTTLDERAAMHKNKGGRGKTPLGAGLDRVDIGG